MKKLICLALFAMMLLPLCAQDQDEVKKCVVFFSATGTTKAAAIKLARQQKAFIWEIKPAEPYTEDDLDWRNPKSRSSVEMNNPEERPAIRQCTNIMPFDTIYIGFPIWWGICPRIINTWIDNNIEQLQSKTLIPFATSGSSGIEQAEAYLKNTYPTLNWQKGLLLNGKK